MIRKLMLALAALAVLGFAAAQVIVSPTEGTGQDAIAKSATEASVEQLVELILPQATALHLAATTITFDLEYLDGPGWEARARGIEAFSEPQYACVYVAGADGERKLGADFWGQEQVIPGLVAYRPMSWDEIKLVYTTADGGVVRDATADDLVVTYPPIRLGRGTGLVPNSKDYFVCYQSFVIQLFSNFANYDLQVSRSDAKGAQSIEHLYVQGNTCAQFGNATGLYDLGDGEMRHLLPKSLTYGPTGIHSSATCNPNSSWMDVLGVLAVKVNADLYGTSTANLTYTLLSSDTKF